MVAFYNNKKIEVKLIQSFLETCGFVTFTPRNE